MWSCESARGLLRPSTYVAAEITVESPDFGHLQPVVEASASTRSLLRTNSERELASRDVIALTTEQQRARTIGWLLQVVPSERRIAALGGACVPEERSSRR